MNKDDKRKNTKHYNSIKNGERIKKELREEQEINRKLIIGDPND